MYREKALTVKARIKILFIKVTKTAKFNLGTLQFPKPVYLAGSANSPRSWGGSGTLYLNVGDRAGDRNIGVNDTSEAYYVEDLGRYSGGGRIIKVSAFGRSNVINGVSRIIANFGDGNDLVFLGRSVPGGDGSVSGIPTIPIEVDMGSGNDGVSYGGSSTVTINAGSGDDYIEIVGTGSATVNAGSGNDFIIHKVSFQY